MAEKIDMYLQEDISKVNLVFFYKRKGISGKKGDTFSIMRGSRG